MDGNKTSKSLSFWRHFEEPTLKASSDSGNIYATHTRQQRDEPEQRNISTSVGTLTGTRTREEPDQDVGNKQYCAIPMGIFCGTETQTFAREEPDPGPEDKQYCAIPKRILCGLKTITEGREEPLQDESSQKYAAIPINTRELE